MTLKQLCWIQDKDSRRSWGDPKAKSAVGRGSEENVSFSGTSVVEKLVDPQHVTTLS